MWAQEGGCIATDFFLRTTPDPEVQVCLREIAGAARKWPRSLNSVCADVVGKMTLCLTSSAIHGEIVRSRFLRCSNGSWIRPEGTTRKQDLCLIDPHVVRQLVVIITRAFRGIEELDSRRLPYLTKLLAHSRFNLQSSSIQMAFELF
jgi:hypothetical protein